MWLTEGYSIRQLKHFSHHHERKLRYIINRSLNTYPDQSHKSYLPHKYLIFDGTFLFQRKGIAALMDSQYNTIISGKYGISESSQKDLYLFFNPLKHYQLNPRCFTVDGNPNVIRFLKIMWPEAIIQRCVIHIQRQGLMWCRQNPKRLDARKLRNIFLQIPKIITHGQRDIFLSDFDAWEKRYGSKLQATPEKGWITSDLKRARSMLLKAIPNMFHFLDDPFISKSTNSLEGYFARLKNHYRHHRGLSPHKRPIYFDWYFFLKNR